MPKRAFWRDDPTVFISDGNFNRALRIFKNRVSNLKLFPILRSRRENPRASDRRKAKAKRAAIRKLKYERRYYK
jgi:ribosomal protein S21